MRATAMGFLVLATVCWTATGRAEETAWMPVKAQAASGQDDSPIRPAVAVELGRPQPLSDDPAARAAGSLTPSAAPTLIRVQNTEPPPPPPPPGAAAPAFQAPLPGGEEPYNCGVVTNNASSGTAGGFFSKCWDNTKQWCQGVPNSVESIFQPGPGGRGLFQSDHKFDSFTSPLSNPFLFEDPRALTELRPIFMWQQAPSQNPQFHGGNNYWFGTQARVAFTDWFSLVVNRFGGDWMDPNAPASPNLFAAHAGFSELWLGPKFTFWRNDACGTIMAAGLTFQIPTGPQRVFQGTGDLSLVPYFSFGQNFLRTFKYGSFNFLNTTGYSFRTDNSRSEYFYTNFHLDFDVGNLHRIYPLIEMQWFHYTINGHPQTLGFEGADLYNFGSNNAGHDEFNIVAGARYKFFEWLQTGFGLQWGLLSPVHHLDGFRMIIDVILRY